MKMINDNSLIKKAIENGLTIETLENAKCYLYETDEFLIRKDQALNSVYVLIEGSCKIYQNLGNGNEGVIHIQNGFQIYGEVELIDGSLAHANIQCLTPVKCIVLDDLEFLRNHVFFLQFCILRLSEKLNTYDLHHLTNNHYSLEKRLANYIIEHQKKNCFVDSDANLASYLGCSYRHLLRVLEKFCKEKILLRKNGYYLIIDEKKLNQLINQ